MLKLVRAMVLLAAVTSKFVSAEESTTASGFQNFFKKIQEAGSNVDFGKLSAGAMKAQETLGPLLSQFKNASQPFLGDVQKKLADAGLVPTTTANPIGSVLKNLQVVGIGSDVDVAKLQENAKKAQDTFAPLIGKFSSFLGKRSDANSGTASASQQPSGGANKSPIDEFIIEDPAAAAAAPASARVSTLPPSAPAAAGGASTSTKSNDFQNALKTIQEAGSKIDFNQVQEGAKKIGSFFNQFKNSGTS